MNINVNIGSARKLKSGKYYWRYRGKGYNQTIYADSRLELEAKVQSFVRLITSDINLEYMKMKLSDLIYEFNNKFRVESISDSTIEIYNQITRDFIEGTCVDKKITELTFKHLQFYFNDLTNKHYYKSITRIKGIINTTLEYAKKLQLITINPIESVILPIKKKCKQKPVSEMVYLNHEELKIFFKILMSDKKVCIRLKTFILVLLFGGFRGNEALGFEWKNINFEKNEIRVLQQIRRLNITDEERKNKEMKSNKNKTHIKKIDLKTPTSYRIVPMEPFVMNQLQELKTHQENEKKNSYGLYDDKDFVFATNVGKAIDLSNERKRLKKLAVKHDIKVVTKNGKTTSELCFHSLRHSFISLLYYLGVDIETCSTLAGHSGSTVTRKVYTHLENDVKIKASRLMLPAIFDTDPTL